MVEIWVFVKLKGRGEEFWEKSLGYIIGIEGQEGARERVAMLIKSELIMNTVEKKICSRLVWVKLKIGGEKYVYEY